MLEGPGLSPLRAVEAPGKARQGGCSFRITGKEGGLVLGPTSHFILDWWFGLELKGWFPMHPRLKDKRFKSPNPQSKLPIQECVFLGGGRGGEGGGGLKKGN